MSGPPTGTTIEVLTPAMARGYLPALIGVPRDAVDSGASVGFLPALPADEAAAYWRGVVDAMDGGICRLLVARHPDLGLVDAVQLDLATRANGRHRAEVVKLLVHRAARRQGIARALMLALEDEARRLGRPTLVLDTRHGDPAEALHRSLGYIHAGVIPQYARSATGHLDATALSYKLLAPAAP